MMKNELTQILYSIGRNIREERRRQSLSQEELADMADVHRTYIGMIERAEKNITILSLERIALALKVPIENLLMCRH